MGGKPSVSRWHGKWSTWLSWFEWTSEQVALITSLIDLLVWIREPRCLYEGELRDFTQHLQTTQRCDSCPGPWGGLLLGGASAECLCTVCTAATGVRAPASRTQRAFHSPTAQSWTLFVRSQMAVAKIIKSRSLLDANRMFGKTFTFHLSCIFLTLHTKIDEKLVSTEGGKSLSHFSFL